MESMGEPWVRYYGIPVEFNAQDNAALYGDYFKPETRFRLTEEGSTASKYYTPYSMFQRQMVNRS